MRTSDLFLGGHVGIGVQRQIGDTFGVGTELRGLTRFGTSDAVDGMSRVRFGFEASLYFLSAAW